MPQHRHRTNPWRQTQRGGSADDRRLREVTVSLPPSLGGVDVTVPGAVGARMDSALREIAALDDTHGAYLRPLAVLLLRAESVASSKIEQVEAPMDDNTRALHGIRLNPSATSMVASTLGADGPDRLRRGGPGGLAAQHLRAHAILMADDASESMYAGRLRDMQNWIGGSDHSPRGAMYVPPPPDTVPAYLDDLVRFANRTDLNVMVQAAITHAQFESVHPFTDGNGRIGRALINTVLRRRAVTRRVVVPLAAALVARREDYFDCLSAYRDGDAGPIVTAFAASSQIAASESQVTARRLVEMPETWREQAGRPRAGSAADRLLEHLLDEPVFSADAAVHRVGGATSSVYAAIARLADAGVIRPLTQRTRNQVWVAAGLADELDDLGVRIAARAGGRAV